MLIHLNLLDDTVESVDTLAIRSMSFGYSLYREKRNSPTEFSFHLINSFDYWKPKSYRLKGRQNNGEPRREKRRNKRTSRLTRMFAHRPDARNGLTGWTCFRICRSSSPDAAQRSEHYILYTFQGCCGFRGESTKSLSLSDSSLLATASKKRTNGYSFFIEIFFLMEQQGRE